MLFVLFHLGNERFALEARQVVEIVPLLELKKIPQAPRGLAGMFIYRGQPVPALDLCALTLGRPAAEHFSTRIIIIQHRAGTATEHPVGLIVERATSTLQRAPQDLVESGVRLTENSFVGNLLKDADGVIQLLNLERLLQQQNCAPYLGPVAAASAKSEVESLTPDTSHLAPAPSPLTPETGHAAY